MLYPFNYENECRIFGLFSLFGIGNHIYESNHSRDELPLFLILTSQAPLLESNSKFIPFSFQRVQPWLNLRRRTLYPTELQRHLFNFWLISWFFGTSACIKRLRRAVLLIKKRAIFDRFISSIRIIDPSAIVRREVGTVASGVISQEDLNSEQICPFSADSCSPFFLGGECSIP